MNKDNLLHLQTEINAAGAQLIAVSKTYPADDIQTAYDLGQRAFGENRVPEFVDKASSLPKDISWHFIGHLQTNKVKYIAPFVHLIHAVDSFNLLKEINKRAKNALRTIDVLLQVKIAQEDSKYGFSPEELYETLISTEWSQLPHVRIVGLMGMATFTDNHVQVSREFATLKSTFDKVKINHFKDQPHFKELSMGMSGDYPLALEQGSTMVRVGSLIFGKRQHP